MSFVPVRRSAVAVLAAALLLVACGSEAKDLVVAPAPEVEPEPESEPEPEPEPEPGPPAPLTGLELEDESVLERPFLLVKVDNAPQARPQSGLDVADLVFEETVEAGVTRFLAVFHSELPPIAGPIRSARPVDVQLMSGYSRSGFAFSGARDEVQPMLRSAPSIVITEGGPGFFRDRSRSAPHNLYIDVPEGIEGIRQRGADAYDGAVWTFDDEVPDDALTCPEDLEGCDDPGPGVTIAMSRSFRTTWTYEADEGVYRRLQNDQPFAVMGEGRIGAANVVVLDTRHYLGGPNCYGSPCPETDVLTSDAPALVLRDGQRFEARYRKASSTDPIEVLDLDGEPFPFKPGRTWIHLPNTLPGLAD